MNEESIPCYKAVRVTSTMDLAAELAREPSLSQRLFAVVSLVQEKGRGRRGREWVQPQEKELATKHKKDLKKNLLPKLSDLESFASLQESHLHEDDILPLTVSIPSEKVKIPVEWCSIAAGCAVFDAIEDLSLFLSTVYPQIAWGEGQNKEPLDPQRRGGGLAGIHLKWPNDIVYWQSDRDATPVWKLAGMLVELSSRGKTFERLNLGLGLNFFQAPEVDGAAALVDALHGTLMGEEPSSAHKKYLKWKNDPEVRSTVLQRFLESLERELIEYLTVPRTVGQLRSLALARMIPLETPLRVDGESVSLPFEGLGDDACLLLLGPHGAEPKRVYAGDASISVGSTTPRQPDASVVAQVALANTSRSHLELLIDFGNTRCHWGVKAQSQLESGHVTYEAISAQQSAAVSDDSLRDLLSAVQPVRRGNLQLISFSVRNDSDTERHLRSLEALLESVFPEMKISSHSLTVKDLLRPLPAWQAALHGYGSTVGIDRALKMFFAGIQADRAKNPVAVLSLGTATTLEIVGPGTDLLESMILPGIQMSFDALAERTAQLPRLEYHELASHDFELQGGKGTVASLARGVVKSLSYVVSQLHAKHGLVQLWVCGGSSAHFVAALQSELFSLPGLVVEVEENLGLLALSKWLRQFGRDLDAQESESFQPLLAHDIGAHGSVDSEQAGGLSEVKSFSEPFSELGERSQKIAASLSQGRKHFRSRTERVPAEEDFRRLGSRIETHGVGERIDRYLGMRFRFHPREEWRERILAGEILIERNAPRVRPKPHTPELVAAKHTYRLKPYDQLWMYQPPEYEPGFVRDTRVVADTGDEIVFHKPGNLVVHATGLYGRNTFLDVLQELGHASVFPVHRIDRETSGLLVCARSTEKRRLLADSFKDGLMEKMYLAIVRSAVSLPEAFVVEAGIGPALDSEIRLKMWVGESPETQSARTRFLRLAQSAGYGLVACFPETGRTNQIRVHLAAAGHWIIGDKMYHPYEEVFLDFYEHGLTPSVLEAIEIPRHALHNTAIDCSRSVEGLSLFEDGPIVCPLSQDLMEFDQVQMLLQKAGMGTNEEAQTRAFREVFEKMKCEEHFASLEPTLFTCENLSGFAPSALPWKSVLGKYTPTSSTVKSLNRGGPGQKHDRGLL